MSLFFFLTIVQALVAAALVGVILVQRSEGGGLGVGGGGSPSGLMSARGAADFLTRSTAILATVFVLLSIVLAAMAVDVTADRAIDTSLDRSVPATQTQPGDPLAGAAATSGGEAEAPAAPGQTAEDPLAGAAQQ